MTTDDDAGTPFGQPEPEENASNVPSAEKRLAESVVSQPDETPDETAAAGNVNISQPESTASTPGTGERPDQSAASRSDEPTVHIEVDVVEGDFSIQGGADYVLLNAGDERNYGEAPEEHQGILHFRWLPGDSSLAVPHGAEIAVRHVEGDLEVENLDGVLMADHVDGDVEIDGVAVSDIATISGELHATRGGSLRIGVAGGDAQLEDFDHEVIVGTTGGDFQATNVHVVQVRSAIGGDATLKRCGEVTLRGSIAGDLRIERSPVTLEASAVGGNVRISDAQAIDIGSVGGDFRVERAAQGVEIRTVGADAHLSNVAGFIKIGTIGGDLTVNDAPRGLSARHVGGDATLDTPISPQAEYSVRAGGDISLRARGEVNARFVAQTLGGEVSTRLPLMVERGRRRNLVGIVGRGEATVTLQSDGGDISIAAADRYQEERIMGDQYAGRDPDGRSDEDERTWEGAFGKHRFRVRWDRGPGRARVHFRGPYTADDDPDGMGTGSSRDFGFEWEKGHGARTYGEYGERLNELRDKAERAARRASEEASHAAEQAARRAKETDWESVGREVRRSIERAMGDLEDAFTQARRDWSEQRRPGKQPPTDTASSGGAQRVRIEYDDGDASGGYSAAPGSPSATASRDDIEAQRRVILEQLRAGTITLDEAERRLNDLH